MSAPQLPVITASAPEAMIFCTYGEKSLTLPIGCSSLPTIWMSGRFLPSMLTAASATAFPKE